MRVADFDYDLPVECIAQHPIEPRDHSRLLHLHRPTGAIHHYKFYEVIDLLSTGDVLVMNNTRVIPARLKATKASGGKVEILLLSQIDELHWKALVGGKGLTVGQELKLDNDNIYAKITNMLNGSERIIAFSKPIRHLLKTLGEVPLPPYIHTQLDDNERYQTVYSQTEGSVAAPTAGLHFTPELLMKIREKGVRLAYCTLHIGLDTFQPVKVTDVESHHIHSERALLTSENAKIINDAKLSGNRVIAVGTTSARTLETAAILSAGGDPTKPNEIGNVCGWRPVIAFEGDTKLFIYPGYQWRVVDAMITNFHLPKSTLLMMISAFAGREHVLNAYEIAKQVGYRFFSFGDAMFIS